MTAEGIYRQRKIVNERSKCWAHRDQLPWTDDEDKFMMQEWVRVDSKDRDEVTVSQVLERTVEACRVHAEHLRKRYGIMSFTVTKTTTVEYRGLMDDPEDQWWSPGYYEK